MSSTTTEAPRSAPTRPTSPVELVDLASSLMVEALASGVEVAHVYTYYSDYPTLTLLTTDAGLAPALAVALGLTERRQQPSGEREVIESFYGAIAGVRVNTQHVVPAAHVEAVAS